MRWLFLFVLFLNLAYIGWQVIQSPADSYAGIVPLNDVAPIVLLNELKLQSESSVIVETAMAEKVESVRPEPEMGEQVVAKEDAGKQQASTEEIATLYDANQEQPETGEEVKKEPEGERELALSNRSVDRCFTMGPFRDLDALSGLTQDIKPYVAATSFRSREESESTVHWVYIKPEKNRKKAIAVGKRLKANKVKDFYVIREGEKINGLSLGHFRNKGGAYGLMKKVKKLGFDVRVEQIHKTYTLYWLDYQLAVGKKIPEPVIEKYMKSAKKEKVTRMSRDCAG